MSKEEEAGMVKSSFNQTTVTSDCNDEKQEIEKEITTKSSCKYISDLDCDDSEFN